MTYTLLYLLMQQGLLENSCYLVVSLTKRYIA